MEHHLKQRGKVLIGLKKTRSLMDKVIQMVEQGNYCIDIMQQNLAAIGLLKGVNQSLLEDHLSHCFKGAMETKNESRKKEMIEEILKVNKISSR